MTPYLSLLVWHDVACLLSTVVLDQQYLRYDWTTLSCFLYPNMHTSRPVNLLLRFTLACLPTLCPTRFCWSAYGGRCIFLENLSSRLFRNIGSHPCNYALSQTRRTQSYALYSQYSLWTNVSLNVIPWRRFHINCMLTDFSPRNKQILSPLQMPVNEIFALHSDKYTKRKKIHCMW
jgi:hypothetical protein